MFTGIMHSPKSLALRKPFGLFSGLELLTRTRVKMRGFTYQVTRPLFRFHSRRFLPHQSLYGTLPLTNPSLCLYC